MKMARLFSLIPGRGCLSPFALLLMVTSVSTSYAAPLVRFVRPDDGINAQNGKFRARVRLTGTSDPKTLKVESGNLDITSMFDIDTCFKTPCTVKAVLTPNNGMLPGWNYLSATVHGANGAAETARLRFSYVTGLQDPTNGTGPPHMVPIQQSGSDIKIMTPTPVDVPGCDASSVRVADLDRSALTVRKTQCLAAADVNTYLKTLDESDLVVAITNGSNGVVDFTPIGGGNYSLGAKLNYAVIGYGGALPGLAFEAWQEPSDDGLHYKTVSGNLVNVGCTVSIPACSSSPNAPFYTFQTANNVGFAIVPGAAGTPGNPGMPTIYLGNPSNPFGYSASNPPPNQVRPTNSITGQDLFSSTTYTPQWTGGSAAGGIYLVILNRSDLTLNYQKLYVTNCNCGDPAADTPQIQELITALTESNPNRLFLLTTAGIPFNADAATAPFIQAVFAAGSDGYALQGIIPDRIGTTAKVGFSMVGYPPSPLQLVDVITLRPPAINKLYSTAANTQQGETGALQGVFAQQHSAYYDPINVFPFSVTSLPYNATPDDYLQNAMSYAIGSTPPVAWPHSTTPGEKSAYSYMSNQLINYNLYCGGNGGSACSCKVDCNDVRSYYTGIDAPTLYAKLQPSAVVYPGDGQGFTKGDFLTVQQQLDLEAVYLSDVVNYQNYTTYLNTNDSLNVAIAMSDAALDFSTTENKWLGSLLPKVGESKVHIAGDAFNDAAAVVSIFGAVTESAAKAVCPIAGIFWTVSGILTTIGDAQKTSQVDPYVVQLQDLMGQNSATASAFATKYNEDVQKASGIFFNGVYSDWFRLQTVALLSLNPNYGGWYVADTQNSRDTYLKTLTANHRIKLWQQVLPNYFAKVGYNQVASGWLQASQQIDSGEAARRFSYVYPNDVHLADPITYGDDTINTKTMPDYTWDNRTSPGTAGVCEDYIYIFFQQNWSQTWSSDFGHGLMGNGVTADGRGDLNIDRNWLYDMWRLPWFEYSNAGDNSPGAHYMKYPQTVHSAKDPNAFEPYTNVNYACGAHPYPWSINALLPLFSSLTPSQTIAQGATSIVLSGKLLVAGALPIPVSTGSVNITINATTNSTPLKGDGSFSYTWVTHSLPASVTPYVITYSYPGTTNILRADNETTTLTVTPVTTTVQLSLSAKTITYGGSVSMVADVTSPSGTPTGSVAFFDGVVQIGSGNLNGGEAKFVSNSLTAGTHSITATYNGVGYQSGTSAATSLVVAQARTLLLSGPKLDPISYHTPSVVVSGKLGVGGSATPVPPSGETVSIQIGSIPGSATIGSGGSFSTTLSTLNLTAGVYPIQINYPGDVDFTALTDTSSILTVLKITPVFTNLTASQKITAGSATIDLGGTIASGDAIPTGTVTVTVNGQTSPATSVGSDGSFKLTVDTSKIVGSATPYTITYQYAGDKNFNQKTDAATTLTVVGVTASSTALISSAASAKFGDSVTFMATVTSQNGMPTGNVTFFDGATSLGSAVLNAGNASFTTSSLAVGGHSVTAVYAGGTAGFAGSTSPALSQTINKLTPMFSNPTPSQTIGSGAASVKLAGTIAAEPSTGSVLQFTQSNNNSQGGAVFTYDASGVSTDSATY